MTLGSRVVMCVCVRGGCVALISAGSCRSWVLQADGAGHQYSACVASLQGTMNTLTAVI